MQSSHIQSCALKVDDGKAQRACATTLQKRHSTRSEPAVAMVTQNSQSRFRSQMASCQSRGSWMGGNLTYWSMVKSIFCGR